MKNKRITIVDVARKAGVSVASVSRFLNNPRLLRKEKREKISAAIKELNYHPLVYAQRLAGGRLNIYGLIIPGYEGIFGSYYATEILRGVGLALEEFSVEDLYINVFWKKDTFKISFVDGVIFADIIDNYQQFLRIKKAGIPLVVINRRCSEEENVSYVAIDNFKGAYEAVEFLISQGHRCIAHLAGDLRVQCAQERLNGYEQALKKNGIEVNKLLIKETNFSRIKTRQILDSLFSLSNPPTAIFAASDELAEEVMFLAQQKNIKIPDQLSLIGYDDNPLSRHLPLALTTVRQPLLEMAKKAVQILYEQINKEDAPLSKIVLSPELIIRDTVKPKSN